MAVAMAAKRWTLTELHRLPDDGNKYELIHGELFVTPAPTVEHEEILARLNRILVPYVAAQGLGYVYRPHAVLQYKGSETEPDLYVRQPHPKKKKLWRTAPIPILVVEVHSPSTKRLDLSKKREYYLEAGVAEYWMIDGEAWTVRVVRAGAASVVESSTMVWRPAGTSTPLKFDVRELFS